MITSPLGQLVSSYRERLPASDNIVVETCHSAFKVTRKADANYILPGRLRHFDLILFDEVSQMDDNVFACVSTALVELSPGPFLVFVGDFKQLQPVLGVGTLLHSLRAEIEAGSFRNIEHLRHENSRSTD